MNQRICDHCGHPSQDGWGELHLIYMGKDTVVDVCPKDIPEARRMLKDFAVFNPDLFHRESPIINDNPPKRGKR